MKNLMMMAVAVAAAMTARAVTEKVGDYTWTYRINGDTAEIFNGSSAAISPSPTGAVTIPSTLGGMTVTSIGDWAFDGCSGLASVTIPSSVARFGDGAFYACSGLTSVTIPNSVKSIGQHAFSECSGLTSVTISDSVTSIAGETFENCSGLKSVTIPNGVTNIEYAAFYGCSALASVTIPDSVTSIEECAFGCSGLLSVIIGDGVKSIGGGAFADSSELSSVTIPSNVRYIGEEAFCGCGKLKDVIIYGDKLTYIGSFAFAGCNTLENIAIPFSTTEIGKGAFAGIREENFYASNSGRIIMPRKFASNDIDYFSFVSQIFDSYTVASWGYDEAYVDISGLRVSFVDSITVPVENGAGLVCTIKGGNAELCDAVPKDVLTNITIPKSANGYPIMGIADRAFYGCKKITSVNILDNVTSIGKFAFAKCNALSSLVVPSSVSFIDERAFVGCCALKDLTLPKWIKKRHFYYDVEDGGYFMLDSALPSTLHVYWQPISVEQYLLVDGDYCCWCNSEYNFENWLKNIKITYKDVKAGLIDGNGSEEVAEIWKKAHVADGAVFRDGNAVGVVQVKVGKASKNGEVAVSGTITGLDGKKLTAKGGKVAVRGESVTATLAVKDGTTATVTIDKDGLSGSWNDAIIAVATVGGDWTGRSATVTVDVPRATLPAGTQEQLLPNDEQATVNGGKWSFSKAASVKWAKPKKGAERPEIFDEASGKGLIVDTSKGKTNLSGMKLTYTPKKGTFKGKFPLYALEGAGKSTKLKKYAVNVTGVVVDGVGYGVATCKKPPFSWSVTVR